MRDPVFSEMDALAGLAGRRRTEAQFDELISAVYAARTVQDWQHVVRQIAQQAEAAVVQLSCTRRVARAPELVVSHELDQVSDSGGSPPLETLAERHRLMGADWLACGQWLRVRGGMGVPASSASAHTVTGVLPEGRRDVLIAKVMDTASHEGVFALMRLEGMPEFDAGTCAWLDRVKGHVMTALALHIDRESGRVSSGRLESLERMLLDQVRLPIVLVDADARIRFSNRCGREMLDAADMLRSIDGRLAGATQDESRALSAALSDVLTPGPMEPPGQGPWVRRRILQVHGQRTGRGITLFVTGIDADGAAMVLAYDPLAETEVDPLLIAHTFGLTPTEARVAMLLARGLTPEQVASHQGVALATVRCHIKSLFAKTGTNRQVDVVRLVAALPPIEPLRAGTRQVA